MIQSRPTPARSRRASAVLGAALAALLLAIVGIPQLGLSGNPGCGLPFVSCTRVLFIGNSYTYVNDLPTIFADLAWSAGYHVDAEALADGGATLAGHVTDPATAAAITSKTWNTVVLQDQSENPASAADRQSEMYPAVTKLAGMIRSAGAEPMLFLTWGHESGWPEAGIATYSSMQAALDQGYLGIAGRLSIPIAPVGAAWEEVNAAEANAQLWQGDGSHPTTAGTYLAACVFFAAIFHRSPVGLSYHGNLQGEEAVLLQRAAAHAAITDGIAWGLP